MHHVSFLYFCFDLGITPSYPLSYQKVQLSASTLINNLLTRLQVYLLLTWINSCLNLGNCVIKYTVSRLLTHFFFVIPRFLRRFFDLFWLWKLGAQMLVVMGENLDFPGELMGVFIFPLIQLLSLSHFLLYFLLVRRFLFF